ncbi:MAG: hypothetical protein LAT62_10285 [Natronospirillum sp.]|uniref:hypothetical protein n=1 Tax=Natronospirillum sp. TaxID=2812955 RepID=UPI0025E38A1C|nr:hypothetical protein [Natronospirillum sp.]MCH8552315.1 hypothetical protein [Natronospirillum sp.]
MRDYIIEASEAGYRVFVLTDGKRYPLGERPYPSLTRARDQIPKRFRGKARLIHRTAYTELINAPDEPSPPLELPVGEDTPHK